MRAQEWRGIGFWESADDGGREAEKIDRLATLDLGMQASLILLQPFSKLNFTKLAITNIAVRGPASLELPLFLPTFPLWPSIIAYPNATV